METRSIPERFFGDHPLPKGTRLAEDHSHKGWRKVLPEVEKRDGELFEISTEIHCGRSPRYRRIPDGRIYRW